MEKTGSVIGMPFSLEGFTFFMKAIFLGIYLYGWERTPEYLHLLCGFIVAISGVVSAVFVTFVNAWMNTPAGFDLVNGQFTNIDFLKPCSIPPLFQKRCIWYLRRTVQLDLQPRASTVGLCCDADATGSMRLRSQSRSPWAASRCWLKESVAMLSRVRPEATGSPVVTRGTRTVIEC
jgi:hypothetical protein